MTRREWAIAFELTFGRAQSRVGTGYAPGEKEFIWAMIEDLNEPLNMYVILAEEFAAMDAEQRKPL